METLILKERETREKIFNVINTSGLPAFIIKPILKDAFEQLNKVEEQQYQQALKNEHDKQEDKEDK